MNMGKAVKIALAMNGMNQTELAKVMGVSSKYISRICNQKNFGIEAAKGVADALNMKVSELIKLGE